MSKWAIHGILMVFVFFIDVRVRASDHGNEPHVSDESKHHENSNSSHMGKAAEVPTHSNVFTTYKKLQRILRDPENCKFTDDSCVFQVKSGPFLWERSDGTWSFATGSIISTSKSAVPRLLEGSLFLRTQENLEIDLGLAKATVSDGYLMVDKYKGQIKIHNLNSEVSVTGSGFQKAEFLPKGFSISIEGVAVNGKVVKHIVGVESHSMLLESWAKLATDSSRYMAEVRQFKVHWREAIETSSAWYKQSVERKIASVKAARLRSEKNRQRIKTENAHLRSLFRQRLGFDIK